MWKNVMQGKVLFQVIDPMFDTGDIKFSYLKINKVIIGMWFLKVLFGYPKLFSSLCYHQALIVFNFIPKVSEQLMHMHTLGVLEALHLDALIILLSPSLRSENLNSVLKCCKIAIHLHYLHNMQVPRIFCMLNMVLSF